MKYFLSLFVMLLLIGCSESATTETLDNIEEPTSYNQPEVEPEMSGESFDGNPCVGDCSGHEAGYQWAQENGIDDPGNCGGNSNSFIEGCQSYAEEQQ